MVEIPKVTFSLLLTGRGKKTEKYKIKTNMPWWMSTRQDKKGKKASNSLLELSIFPLGNPLRWHLSLFFIATYTFVHKCVQISLSHVSLFPFQFVLFFVVVHFLFPLLNNPFLTLSLHTRLALLNFLCCFPEWLSLSLLNLIIIVAQSIKLTMNLRRWRSSICPFRFR